MSASTVVRSSGLCLFVGCVVFAGYVLALSVLTAQPDPLRAASAAAWVPVNVLGIAAACTVLAGLPGSYARVAARGGALGLVGVVLVGIAWTFFGVFLSLYATLLLPWLATAAPQLLGPSGRLPTAFILAFVIGLLLWCAGSVLLAVALARAHAAPPWWGFVLVGSGVWAVVGDTLIAPEGPAASWPVNLLSNFGPILLMLALAHLGLGAWQEGRARRDTIVESAQPDSGRSERR